MKLRKGDLVEVTTGEEAGRRGKVIKILKKGDRAIIEGVNLVKRHRRTTRPDRPGGIIEIPAPIHISNLVLLCPHCGEPTRLRRQSVEGRRRRICIKCQGVIE
jgi:large subunit ribosomal protein L24